ncbi:MAG: hypothetical protein JAZ17_02450 [Candidatus Thiodiazotropha endolucinida]|nr:hypothetical protein [Candidatus Thiodiazotropha endolucinida]
MSEELENLKLWNNLNKENAEQEMVSVLFQSFVETAPMFGNYSTWLLIGTGTVSAFLVAQIDSVLPYLSVVGYKLSLLSLAFSAVFGFLSKEKVLHCEIQLKVISMVYSGLPPVFEKHEKEEAEIIARSEQLGVKLDTDIDIEKVFTEAYKPFPFWIKWKMKRAAKDGLSNRQAHYHILISSYLKLMWSVFFQVVFFLLFIVTASIFAGNI